MMWLGLLLVTAAVSSSAPAATALAVPPSVLTMRATSLRYRERQAEFPNIVLRIRAADDDTVKTGDGVIADQVGGRIHLQRFHGSHTNIVVQVQIQSASLKNAQRIYLFLMPFRPIMTDTMIFSQ